MLSQLKVYFLSSLFVFLGAANIYAAEDPKVEITSFVYAGLRTRASELCGKVTGIASEWIIVRVVVDPKANRPGIYNTMVGKDGHFCTSVVSFSGLATASIGWGSEREIVSNTAVLVRHSSR